MLNLEDLFIGLRAPSDIGDSVFTAQDIPGWPQYKIARDKAGRPALLIVAQSRSSVPYNAIELRHLSFTPRVLCELREGPLRTTGEYAILRCSSQEAEFHRLFLRIVASWIPTLGEAPSTDAVASSIDRLASLFHNLSRPSRGEVMGLWGELLIIASATNPEFLIRSWHTDPGELHDFVCGAQVIEVKSSPGAERIHNFSLQQLVAPAGSVLVFASLLLYEEPTGATVEQLITAIQQSVSEPELRFRVLEVVTRTLGRDWPRAATERFSVQRALENLRWYQASAVPSISPDSVPAEVSDVRFRADLGVVGHIDLDAYTGHGGLLSAAVPRRRNIVLGVLGS